jgi:nitrate reductase gamma subunit
MRPAVSSTIGRLIEYGPRLRSQPLLSITFFLFYVCLFGIPLFLLAHNTLWEEAFSVSLPSLPGSFADVLTVVFLILALALAGRRIINAEARHASTALDYCLVVLIIAPFLTGSLAYHQIGPYKLNLILHIIFAEMLLIVIPFSKLSHIAFSFRGK